MHVKIIDYYGVNDWFKVIKTGKVPEGFGRKISVTFFNSKGEKEKSIVNHHHIQVLKNKNSSLKEYSKIHEKATYTEIEQKKLLQDNPKILENYYNNLDKEEKF